MDIGPESGNLIRWGDGGAGDRTGPCLIHELFSDNYYLSYKYELSGWSVTLRILDLEKEW